MSRSQDYKYVLRFTPKNPYNGFWTGYSSNFPTGGVLTGFKVCFCSPQRNELCQKGRLGQGVQDDVEHAAGNNELRCWWSRSSTGLLCRLHLHVSTAAKFSFPTPVKYFHLPIPLMHLLNKGYDSLKVCRCNGDTKDNHGPHSCSKQNRPFFPSKYTAYRQLLILNGTL